MVHPQSLFRCQYPGCGSSYRRKEHLKRHAKGHDQTKPYSCLHCDRSFSRNDILRQHIRRNHDGKQLQSERTIKACNQCRRRRSKCTGDNPCRRCILGGLKCSFSQPEAGSASPVSLIRSESLEQSSSRAVPIIEAYFDKFHPEWPFLHRATFDPEHEPQSLLQSVIMMGMLMIDPDDAHYHALNIHSKLTSLMNEQRDNWDISSNPYPISRGQDPTPAPWPIATYQGILLQIIFSLLHPSNRSVSLRLFHILPETTSRLLVSLVQTCLRRTMFFYPSILAQFELGSNPDVFVWLGIEEIKRFALCLYKTCQSCQLNGASVAQSGRRKGSSATGSLPASDLLNLGDLQFALPANDDLWHVDSDLATKLTERSVSFSSECDGEDWISRAAVLIQPGNRSFRWL